MNSLSNPFLIHLTINQLQTSEKQQSTFLSNRNASQKIHFDLKYLPCYNENNESTQFNLNTITCVGRRGWNLFMYNSAFIFTNWQKLEPSSLFSFSWSIMFMIWVVLRFAYMNEIYGVKKLYVIFWFLKES